MTFLERLRRARTAPKAILHRVILNEKPGELVVHALFEGKDEESFLSTFIERYVPEGWRLCRYRCGGKTGVLGAKAEIESRAIDQRRTWYFVDKDHDDFLGVAYSREIFVTRFYSIENEIVSEAVLVRILRDLLSVDDHGVEDAVVDHFGEQLATFHRALLPLSAWIIAARQNGLRPNLSAVRLGTLFEFSDDLVLRRKRRPGLLGKELARTNVRVEEGWRQVMSMARELRAQTTPKKHVRGKWELWFFIHFALGLPTIIDTADDAASRQLRFRINLGLKTAIQVLGPRTPEPPDLREFLLARNVDLEELA
jgi:hypothetical protein